MNQDQLIEILKENLDAGGDGTVAYIKEHTIEAAAIAIMKKIEEESQWRSVKDTKWIKPLLPEIQAVSIVYLLTDGLQIFSGFYNFRDKKWQGDFKKVTHYREIDLQLADLK